MPDKTSYDRDMRNGIKRKMVRLTKEEDAAIKKSRARHGQYAPTFSAIVRRGLVLACAELDQKPVNE